MSWLGNDDAEISVVPAIVPRMLPLISNRMFPPNMTLFFSQPQRMPPRAKRVIGSMPVAVEESLQGVWTDGVLITVSDQKRAVATLRASGPAEFPSLSQAAAHFYGTLAHPKIERSDLQDPVDERSDDALTEPGSFWHQEAPVARSPI